MSALGKIGKMMNSRKMGNVLMLEEKAEIIEDGAIITIVCTCVCVAVISA